MFTIKHIDNASRETLYNGANPCMDRNMESTLGQTVTFWTGEEQAAITGGTVYIMNDNGKTVATYHLGGPIQTKSQTSLGTFFDIDR